MKTGQTALLIGASGGVGTMAVQLAKIKGARVIAVSSGKNKDYVMNQLQADDFIDYKKEKPVEAIDEKVDLVFDMAGGVQLQESYKLVRPGGKIVSIAGKFENSALLKKENKTFHYVFVEPHSRQLDELNELSSEGRLKPYVQQVFSLEEMKKAHKLIESGHTTGKIAVSI